MTVAALAAHRPLDVAVALLSFGEAIFESTDVVENPLWQDEECIL